MIKQLKFIDFENPKQPFRVHSKSSKQKRVCHSILENQTIVYVILRMLKRYDGKYLAYEQ